MSRPLPAKRACACPSCGAALTWIETQRIQEVCFDYYLPCAGCGTLVCFNRSEDVLDVLILGVQPEPRDASGIRVTPPTVQ